MIRPELICLDFDGVVMDSMQLKLESYLTALAPWGLPPLEVKRIQRETAGLSRQKSIPHMLRTLRGIEINGVELEHALERFRISDEASREKMKLLPGAAEFFAQVAERNERAGKRVWNLAILTGTPQNVIHETLRYFNLHPHFMAVMGSPPDKASWLREVMAQHKLTATQIVFVGDSPQDQKSALEAGVPFIGMASETINFQATAMLALIRSLPELLALYEGENEPATRSDVA